MGVLYVVNVGCYVIGLIVLLCLLCDVGVLVVDVVVVLIGVLGYIGGGKVLIVEFDDGIVVDYFFYVVV